MRYVLLLLITGLLTACGTPRDLDPKLQPGAWVQTESSSAAKRWAYKPVAAKSQPYYSDQRHTRGVQTLTLVEYIVYTKNGLGQFMFWLDCDGKYTAVVRYTPKFAMAGLGCNDEPMTRRQAHRLVQAVPALRIPKGN